MQIKEIAKKYNLQPDTIRYYEKENLIYPKRLDNGYRDYDESCEEQLQFILVFKQLGFSIKEIHQLFEMKGKTISIECNDTSVLLLDQKITNIENKIEFYQNALEVIQKIKILIDDGKYEENMEVIEKLLLNFYKDIYKERV